MAVTRTPVRFELVQCVGEMESYIRKYPEEASQSFVIGDPVVLDGTTGEVEIGVDTGNIFGIALTDASGTAGTQIDVLVIDPTMWFSGVASNAGADQATAQTMVGLKCSFIKSTETGYTTVTVLDTADTTTPTFEIIGLDGRDTVGDTAGRVIFRAITGVGTTAR